MTIVRILTSLKATAIANFSQRISIFGQSSMVENKSCRGVRPNVDESTD